MQNKTRTLVAQPSTEKKLQLNTLRHKGSQHKLGLGRLISHGAIIATIAGFVVAGTYKPSLAAQANGMSGDGAVSSSTDQTSVLAAAAVVAESTNSVITADVKEQANTASAQVYLATAGDGFLAKKQPVQTAGNQTRDISSYTAKSGDTLWSISSQFNITTDTIMWANGMDDSSLLRPGAQLTILPVNGVLYKAHGGEDINALATKYQSNAAQIDSFNDLQGAAPLEGMSLVIPDGVMPRPASVGAPAATKTTVAAAAVTSVAGPSYRGNGNGYWPGQCTWYVASRRAIPGNWGNAYSWYYNAQASGFAVGSAPRAGAIGWERGINHVVYVESVNANGSVNVSEMNFNYQAGVLHYRTMPASALLYIY